MQPKNDFEELFETMQKSRKRCLWAKTFTLEQTADMVLGEAKELDIEIKSKDYQKAMDELGDTLAVTMFLAVLAEEKGHFTIRDSLKNAVAKFRRRKPWIFDDATIKVETVEEARRLWNQAKQKEKTTKTISQPMP